ncbi:hypothetical protein PIB30_011102 [Stylosanthes scabra]|uniref:Uncharacterized protein n=1 Tax=Stylosanthes scabra TaxID=79078 RepID=A0ABU6Z7J2_9FABA|nr:hypothetical protein [Stylosanthes scabra]
MGRAGACVCGVPPYSAILFFIVVRTGPNRPVGPVQPGTGPLNGSSHLKDRRCIQTGKDRSKPAGSVKTGDSNPNLQNSEVRVSSFLPSPQPIHRRRPITHSRLPPSPVRRFHPLLPSPVSVSISQVASFRHASSRDSRASATPSVATRELPPPTVPSREPPPVTVANFSQSPSRTSSCLGQSPSRASSCLGPLPVAVRQSLRLPPSPSLSLVCLLQ